MKEKAPDLTGHPIPKLPPGKALGADDLRRWSHGRATGEDRQSRRSVERLKPKTINKGFYRVRL